MRHLSTLIAAVFIAPLAWVLLAFGESRSTQAFENASISGADFVRPAVCLAGAGLLLGLLATLRFSPLGAVVAGAAYAASYLALLVAPKGVLDLFSMNVSIAGRHADMTTPIKSGTTLLLGALMLVAVGSVARWRAWPSTVETPAPPKPVQTLPEDRPLGADGLREPEYATRYANAPRFDGPPQDDTGAWAMQRRTTWPFS
jgi:hypothetical protein